MHLKHTAVAALSLYSTAVMAQRPKDTSICDYYTTALLKNNTAANQLTLLTLVVNTAVIGNYTTPNVGIAVPGILAMGTYNDTKVNLLPYFSGGLESSNRGGAAGTTVNFLDGGGAEPLKKNMPANDTSSNQYFLLTHLYSFFGALLGCTQYGMGAFPAYNGHASMYEVHKFMDLNPFQLGYFIEQVALSAASFGVSKDDLTPVGETLGELFGMRCAAPVAVIPALGPQLEAICVDGACPLAMNATCSAYDKVLVPMNSTTNATALAPGSVGDAGNMTMSGSGTMTMTGTMSGSMTMTSGMTMTTGTAAPSSAKTAGAAVATAALNMLAVAGGLAAIVL